jgi:hypothetical protein
MGMNLSLKKLDYWIDGLVDFWITEDRFIAPIIH